MQKKTTMIIRTKHNKRRNTAFLYEILARELTKSIIEKNEMRKATIISIIKEHFKKDSLLSKELKLYSSIYEASETFRITAERIINECKRLHDLIDKQKLFVEQTKLIETINKRLTQSVFANFVPFYKNLATISQIFNISTDIKDKIILEQLIINEMCSKVKQDQLKPMDDLICSTFLKKFNEKYSDNLIKEQKDLINHYIMSFSDNGLSLKYYINEEILRLKGKITEVLTTPEIALDEELKDMTSKLNKKLDSYNQVELNKEMISEILKIQSFVEEATAK